MTDVRARDLIADDRVEKIVKAASEIDEDAFERLSRGDDLAMLSSQTHFEDLEVASGGVLAAGEDGFEASATVYVTLNYGSGKEQVSMTDSYPAVVKGTFDADGATITEVEVDTSGFYA